MRKILIIGKMGQVGWDLQHSLGSQDKIIALDRHDIDLSKPKDITVKIRDIHPDVIINAAAYTNVEKAESEEALAMAINGTAPGVLAEEAKRLKAIFIHYSTDYVFDGSSKTPYTENDQTHPLNEYGTSKLAGENAITSVGGSHLILRTSWIYSSRGKNFLLTMLKLGNEKKTLKIINDQVGVPNWSSMIAQTTARILAASLKKPDDDSLWGLYHLSSAGKASWFQFAQAIFKQSHHSEPSPELIPISSKEYPTKAVRPQYSVLSCEKLCRAFALTLPAWETSLEQCLKEMNDE